MKKKIELEKIFYGNWSCAKDVFSVDEYVGFDVSEADQQGIEFIYASYDTGAYEGEALVIFIRDGKLYEVNDSHCSCHGLANWRSEETSFAALMFRPNVPLEAKANLKQVFKNLTCFL
jgi:hypothetical protein